MPDKTIVLVYDGTSEKRAEVNVLDDPHQAARLVETLLEAGFKQEQLRIYTGAEMEMQVTHRPVVALVGDVPGASAARDDSDSEPAQHRAKTEPKEAEVTAGPGTRDGVRLSSLFRTA